MATRTRVVPPSMARTVSGSSDPREEGLSFLQLKIPMILHYEFREELMKKRLSINMIAEDVIRYYLSYMKSTKWVKPKEAKQKKQKRRSQNGQQLIESSNPKKPSDSQIPRPTSMAESEVTELMDPDPILSGA